MSDTVTLSSGVVLNVKRVSRFVLGALAKQMPEPVAPVVYIEDKGRKEQNPNDPEFLARHQQWQFDMGLRSIELMVRRGTSLNYCPDDIDKPESDEWLNDMLAVDIELNDDDKSRYTAWVMYVACVDDDDYAKITTAVARASGVSEEDVKEAAETFRSVD